MDVAFTPWVVVLCDNKDTRSDGWHQTFNVSIGMHQQTHRAFNVVGKKNLLPNDATKYLCSYLQRTETNITGTSKASEQADSKIVQVLIDLSILQRH
ncbi:hypothetical protein JHK85_011567 [Glycine max]|nr:hypothetical protein JHK85_011567 [Glycine max]